MQLQTAAGVKFGQVINLAIIVPKFEEEKKVEESLLLANRDKSVGESGVRNPYVELIP